MKKLLIPIMIAMVLIIAGVLVVISRNARPNESSENDMNTEISGDIQEESGNKPDPQEKTISSLEKIGDNI